MNPGYGYSMCLFIFLYVCIHFLGQKVSSKSHISIASFDLDVILEMLFLDVHSSFLESKEKLPKITKLCFINQKTFD